MVADNYLQNWRGRWKRLLIAVLFCAAFSVVWDISMSGGFSTRDELPSVGLGLVFYAIGYSISVPTLYFVSVTLRRFRIPGWIVFPLLFASCDALLWYCSLRSYDSYEQGGRQLVIDHNNMPAGLQFIETGVGEMFFIAALAGLILFLPSSRRS